MKYKEYTVEDYLLDEDFQNWVRSGKETDFLKDHGLDNPKDGKVVSEASIILEALAPQKESLSDQEINDKWSLLENEIQSSSMSGEQLISPPFESKKTSKNSVLKYAAAISLIVLSAILYFYMSIDPEAEFTTYKTDFGQKRSIALADGTHVNLNANSELKVSDFNSNNQERRVWLSGEAFFNVAKGASAKEKFVVKAGTVDIVVLGTEFNVLHRGRLTRIALRKGSVKLEADNGAEYGIEPNQVVIYNQYDKVFAEDAKKDTYYYAWLENKMVLDETSLDEVGQIIEDNFGVKVSIVDAELKDRKLSGVVSDDNLPVLLEAIKNSLGVQISQNDKGIRIY